jgi:hypothetical protein
MSKTKTTIDLDQQRDTEPRRTSVTKASSTTMLSVRVPRAMVRELNKFVETQKLTWPMGRFTITSVVNGILKQYLADQHATDEDSSDR